MRPAGPGIAGVPLRRVATGCAHAPGDFPGPDRHVPSEVTDFSTLYSENCAACHGANGQNGPAIDLANPEYQALVDDATLRKWISGGNAWHARCRLSRNLRAGMLTDAQVTSLVAGMRKRWSRPDVFAGSHASALLAESQPGDAESGEQIYQSRCAQCHASSPEQITSSVYLAVVGDQALRSIIIAGRPDIGQPDWRHLGPSGTDCNAAFRSGRRQHRRLPCKPA